MIGYFATNTVVLPNLFSNRTRIELNRTRKALKSTKSVFNIINYSTPIVLL